MAGAVSGTLRSRWPVLIIPSAVYFVSHFHRIALGVVAQDLMRAFGIPAAAVGALAAIYPYVFVAMALVAGSLTDMLGPRFTMTGGALAMGVGAVVFGTAPSFMIAVVGRLLIGAGASVVLIAFLGLAAEWFAAGEFATIAGLTQTVGNIGGLAAAAPLALLVDAIGWRGSFAMVGTVTTALAILAALGIRDRPPGHDARVERSLGGV